MGDIGTASCRSVPIILFERAVVVDVGAEILKATSYGWTLWVRFSQTIRTTLDCGLYLLRAIRVAFGCAIMGYRGESAR
ncbi:MAG: hypothetical protein ACRYGK_06855 [Janthinobacterium lividum]